MAPNKTTHTPGPWNAVKFVSDSYAKSAPYSYHIASPETNVGTCDVREADACLIAAAPELLAALKAALPMLEMAGSTGERKAVEDMVKAAIAKAERK